MFRLLFIISSLALANAFSSSYSSFAGSVVSTSVHSGSVWEMKKGKANVPPQMRSQYKRQQEMEAMRQEMIAATKPGSDGLPVFNLFVRTPRANMWYPCGSFKGDERSKALCDNYSSGGLMSGMAKKQLDGGIAESVFKDLDKLKETTVRAYPQLRKSKDELQFGYKIAYQGMKENEPVQVIEPKEQKGIFDNLKTMFS